MAPGADGSLAEVNTGCQPILVLSVDGVGLIND